MPTELIKEFIGKECIITLINETFEVTGKVIDIEGYWIKIQEKDTRRIINGAMIRDIKMMLK